MPTKCSLRFASGKPGSRSDPLLKQHRDQIKPDAIWEIEKGAALTSSQVARAMLRHAELLARVREFQERFDFLVCTVSQVPPFDAALDWPHDIDGVAMQTYVDWMKSAYWISATMCPAISVPAGFTDDGPAGRFADCRDVSARLRRPQDGARVRASDECRRTGARQSRHSSGESNFSR